MEASVKQSVLDLNRAVPRYTSYPTAPHFKEGFDETAYQSWLKALPSNGTLSLYVHVPFCPKLCWFCGCNTKITHREAPVDEYAETLKREIAMIAGNCPKGMPVKHLHFGGGSPTILKPSVFEDVIKTLRENFSITLETEIAVEIDPRNFTEGLAAVYARCGVNRASFGVQDFDDKVMTAVNRSQSFACVYKAVNLARSYGIKGINIDLMYGLPYQTVETMKKLAENIQLLAPDRIALFGYAHVPWMKKHMRLIPDDGLPDDALRYDLFETAANIIEKAGYVPIGIDHFAKPDDAMAIAHMEGTLRRNFQGYTTDNADALIGFGASAISRLPQGYVQNTVHGPQYRDRIEGGHLPVEKVCALDADDRLHAEIIERLITDLNVDTHAICQKHGQAPKVLADDLKKLADLQKSGLVKVEKSGRVSVATRQMARLACAAFDRYLQPPTDTIKRHVTAV